MAQDDKPPATNTTAPGPVASDHVAVGDSATVELLIPTDPGSAGTQTPAATAMVPQVTGGAVGEYPILSVLEHADPNASKLALSYVATAAVRQLVNEARQKDDAIRALTAKCDELQIRYTDERLARTRLEYRADPPLTIGGTLVVALATALLGVDHSGLTGLLGAALIVVGASLVLFRIWRPTWLR